MKKALKTATSTIDADDLLPEYHFDYSKAKPNRFAAKGEQRTVAVVLDPDVAAVFKDASSVNAVLRALLATMPRTRRTSPTAAQK